MQDTGLSPAAKKVYPELMIAGETMRKPRPEAKGESVVHVGNKITEGQKTSSEVIDFDLAMTAAKSELVQDPQITPEKRTIRRRFMDKVRSNVIGEETVVV